MNLKEKRRVYPTPRISVFNVNAERIMEGSDNEGSIESFTNSSVDDDGWETM